MSVGLLIFQSGGPTPVGNTILAAAVDEAAARLPPGVPIFGARYGFRGLVSGDFVDLRGIGADDWTAIASSPGAALGSSRYRPDDGGLGRLIDRIASLGIGTVIGIGGNGSMAAVDRLAAALSGRGLPVRTAGIPDTVDNDIAGTDFTPGFGSCARAFAQAVIDVAADVRSLPTPVSIVEVMGRNTGWLTAATVLARRTPAEAPHRIYIPEARKDIGAVIEDVRIVYERYGWAVIAVSEGADGGDEGGWSDPAPIPRSVDHGGPMVGDTGAVLARLFTRETGIRARSEKPGLTARSAMAMVSRVDRRAAGESGRTAVRMLLDGRSRFMVSLRRTGGEQPDWECIALRLEDAAGIGRCVSSEYIDPLDGQPNDRFVRYAGPIIGELTHHRSLIDL